MDTQSECSLYWHTANGRDLRANYSPKSTGTKQGLSKQKAQGLKTESFIVLPPNMRAELSKEQSGDQKHKIAEDRMMLEPRPDTFQQVLAAGVS